MLARTAGGTPATEGVAASLSRLEALQLLPNLADRQLGEVLAEVSVALS
jgi:hypothetical protein